MPTSNKGMVMTVIKKIVPLIAFSQIAPKGTDKIFICATIDYEYKMKKILHVKNYRTL